MCLLFFNIDNEATSGQYKLVLVNVRDEMYHRPAKPVDFWSHDGRPSIIGGQDVMPGRTGGTWLAMNKDNGRIGVLLNILQPKDEVSLDKLGRGFIVTDFLEGQDGHHDYVTNLSGRGSDFNGFQTIVLEVNDVVQGSYYSNFLSKPPSKLEDGVHSFGNSLNPYDPWPKVTYGRKRFQGVLSKHKTIETKDGLIQDLLDMMADKTLLPIDQQMVKQGGHDRLEKFIKRLSSLCVEMPDVMYGSRTWTVILVDGDGNVDYVEKNYEEPIQTNPTSGVVSPSKIRSFHFKCS